MNETRRERAGVGAVLRARETLKNLTREEIKRHGDELTRGNMKEKGKRGEKIKIKKPTDRMR